MFKWTAFLLTFSSVFSQVVCNDECSKILGSTNQERAKVGKPPLCINAALMMAAQTQANYQASINTMTHTGAGGSTAGDRVTSFGFQWTSCAENVAQGQTSAHGVMLGWMNSPEHKRNILSDNTEMGIAHVGEFWAQTFGTPKQGSGGCNVAPVGGPLGQVEAQQPDIGPRCDSMCNSLLSVVNTARATAGLPPVCISPKLMAAAQKVVTDKNNYRPIVEATGFGAKGVGLAQQSIHSSAGPPTDSDILTMFRQHYRGSAADVGYSRVGIASDGRRENWFLVFAGTYTPDLDQCESLSLSVSPLKSSARGLPPVPTSLPASPPASPPASLPASAAASSCSQYLTPCQCVGACGWSSTTSQCYAVSATVYTDCTECPSQARCLADAASAKSPTPR